MASLCSIGYINLMSLKLEKKDFHNIKQSGCVTPKSLTFDRLAEKTLADFVTDFVTKCDRFLYLLVFLVGVKSFGVTYA